MVMMVVGDHLGLVGRAAWRWGSVILPVRCLLSELLTLRRIGYPSLREHRFSVLTITVRLLIVLVAGTSKVLKHVIDNLSKR